MSVMAYNEYGFPVADLPALAEAHRAGEHEGCGYADGCPLCRLGYPPEDAPELCSVCCSMPARYPAHAPSMCRSCGS